VRLNRRQWLECRQVRNIESETHAMTLCGTASLSEIRQADLLD